MSDDAKTPIDQALDLFVYAPLGFAFSFRDLAKQAAEKGRQQVQMAKMVGQFAVQMGQQQAEQKLRGARQQAEEVVGSFLPGGGRPAHVPPAPAAPTAPQGRGPATTEGPGGRVEPEVPPTEHVKTSAPSARTPVTEPGDTSITTPTPRVARRPAPTAPPPDVAALAIPAYDTLSASQVVQRLAGLSAGELEAVRAYEAAGRGRKTILHKIEQLKA